MERKLLAALVTGAFLLGMVGVANALFVADGGVGFTDIGGYDTFVAQTVSVGTGNGKEVELAWINSVLLSKGVTYTYTIDEFSKTEDTGTDESPDPVWISLWKRVYSDEIGTVAVPEGWAFALTDPADYFMVKTGNNQTAIDYRYFLFQNLADINWAAFQLSPENGDYQILEFGKLSHISQVGTPVPEPAMLLLFGTGVVGLVGVARRRNKK